MASAARRREVAEHLERAPAWAAARDDVVALALVGSWARDAADADSDVDLIVLTGSPAPYTAGEEWIEGLAPGAQLARTGAWGPIVERRLLLPSGLEVEVGIGPLSWAETSTLDPGTRRVVRDGIRALHDPQGLLAVLVSACR